MLEFVIKLRKVIDIAFNGPSLIPSGEGNWRVSLVDGDSQGVLEGRQTSVFHLYVHTSFSFFATQYSVFIITACARFEKSLTNNACIVKGASTLPDTRDQILAT